MIKPQGTKCKIFVPDSYVEDNVNEELVAPATSVAPEEIIFGNIDLEICNQAESRESDGNAELTSH